MSADDQRVYYSVDDARLAVRHPLQTLVPATNDLISTLNATLGVGRHTLTPDELTLFFQSGGDIWSATRDSLSATFANPMLVSGDINTVAFVEDSPRIFGDTIFFFRDDDIYSGTITASAVPEPSSFLLLTIGGIGSGMGIRRRKRRQDGQESRPTE
ncbi:MAG: PEP-CTERM sorting domain-containing protein [Rubripirellula sp.]